MKKEIIELLEIFAENKEIDKSILIEKLSEETFNKKIPTLLELGIITNNNNTYELSQDAESLIPIIKQLKGEEKNPLVVSLVAILGKNGTEHENKICLLKRNKRPYQNYWGLIGGKMQHHESIRETTLREVYEETNINSEYDKQCAVLHERIHENNTTKHSMILFLSQVYAINHDTKNSSEGNTKWFKINNLPENIIPSDKYMIENLLHKNNIIKEIKIHDKTKEMKIEEPGTF